MQKPRSPRDSRDWVLQAPMAATARSCGHSYQIHRFQWNLESEGRAGFKEESKLSSRVPCLTWVPTQLPCRYINPAVWQVHMEHSLTFGFVTVHHKPPRFGKALSKLRTAHGHRLKRDARRVLKHNLANYRKVARNTRSDRAWIKHAKLDQIFDYLG